MTDLSTQEFLARLAQLANEPVPTPRAEFLRDLKSLPNFLTVAEWAKVVEFAADQYGRWETQLCFSPARSPDTNAAAEAEAWHDAWSVCSKELVAQLPELAKPLQAQFDLAALRYSLPLKLKHDQGKPIAKMMSLVLSKVSIFLTRVGWFDGISQWLYGTALFPPGTVGRASK